MCCINTHITRGRLLAYALPKPHTGSPVQVTRGGPGRESAHGDFFFATWVAMSWSWWLAEQGEWDTLSLGIAPSMPALLTLIAVEGHLGKLCQGHTGASLISGRLYRLHVRWQDSRKGTHGCWTLEDQLDSGQRTRRGRSKTSTCSLSSGSPGYQVPQK